MGIPGYLYTLGIPGYLSYTLGVTGYLYTLGVPGYLYTLGLSGHLYALGIPGYLYTLGVPGYLYTLGVPGYLYTVGVSGNPYVLGLPGYLPYTPGIPENLPETTRSSTRAPLNKIVTQQHGSRIWNNLGFSLSRSNIFKWQSTRRREIVHNYFLSMDGHCVHRALNAVVRPARAHPPPLPALRGRRPHPIQYFDRIISGRRT